MRIISGIHKGRRILAPKNLPVRPTTDQAKEALFNILGNHFDFSNIKALDLFSGIGSISLELGSRGTPQITAVDRFYKNTVFLKETAEKLNLPVYVIKADVFDFLKTHTQPYELIFADPPYDFSIEELFNLVDSIFNRNLLSANGLLVIEHSKHKKIPKSPYLLEERRYGSAIFSFFSTPPSPTGLKQSISPSGA